jgi:hypothetical protein
LTRSDHDRDRELRQASQRASAAAIRNSTASRWVSCRSGSRHIRGRPGVGSVFGPTWPRRSSASASLGRCGDNRGDTHGVTLPPGIHRGGQYGQQTTAGASTGACAIEHYDFSALAAALGSDRL